MKVTPGPIRTVAMSSRLSGEDWIIFEDEHRQFVGFIGEEIYRSLDLSLIMKVMFG